MAAKSTYELDPDVKFTLHTWYGELRRRGIRASQKAIIEVLVESSDLETVARLLEVRANSTGRPTAPPSGAQDGTH